MRRNSTYSQDIVRIALFAILVIYLSFSTTQTSFTPLLGVVTTYIIFNINRHNKFFSLSLAFIYLLLFEASFDFHLFSFILLLILQYRFLLTISKVNLYHDFTVVTFSVIFSYTIYLIINNFISYLANIELFSIDFKSFSIYIISDIVLASVLFL